jgi:hypothetical protein
VVEERVRELPVISVEAVTDDPAAVAEQLVQRPASDGGPSSQGRWLATGSSSRSCPLSTSWRTAVAVNIFECDATRNRWSGVIATCASTSANPYAVDSMSSPSTAIAAWTPGTRSSRCRKPSHESRYGAAARAASADTGVGFTTGA